MENSAIGRRSFMKAAALALPTIGVGGAGLTLTGCPNMSPLVATQEVLTQQNGLLTLRAGIDGITLGVQSACFEWYTSKNGQRKETLGRRYWCRAGDFFEVGAIDVLRSVDNFVLTIAGVALTGSVIFWRNQALFLAAASTVVGVPPLIAIPPALWATYLAVQTNRVTLYALQDFVSDVLWDWSNGRPEASLMNVPVPEPGCEICVEVSTFDSHFQRVPVTGVCSPPIPGGETDDCAACGDIDYEVQDIIFRNIGHAPRYVGDLLAVYHSSVEVGNSIWGDDIVDKYFVLCFDDGLRMQIRIDPGGPFRQLAICATGPATLWVCAEDSSGAVYASGPVLVLVEPNP